MGRTYNKTCEECGDPFVATGSRQRECDSCWGKAMGAVRVEHQERPGGRQAERTAIIVCRECNTEYATATVKQAHPGLCHPCSRKTEQARRKVGEARRDFLSDPVEREKLAERARGNKNSLGRVVSEETRRKIGDAHRGMKHTPEAIARISEGARRGHREKKLRGIAQGGKFGWLYVVAGGGQVKVGGSMDADTLAKRLAIHAMNGLADVCGTWQVDPRNGGALEAQSLAAVLSEWDQVGTTIRPDGGTETVWCDDPHAVVAVVEEIVSQRVA